MNSPASPSFQRIFLGWDRPALHTAAERLAEAYAGPEALEMSGATVVLPGRRPGRRLKELLLEEAERRGVRLAPPRIITLGRLPELLYEADRPAVDAVVSGRLWAEALRATDPAVRERVYPRPPELDDLRGWERVGGELRRLHGEVGAGGHGFADVARICADHEHGLFEDDARWEALAVVEEHYAGMLSEANRSDQNLARIAALRSRNLRCETELWLLGLAEMPRVIRRMLEAVSGEVRILVHAPTGEASTFDALGCVRPAAWAERVLELSDEDLRIVDRPGDQANAALVAVAELCTGRTTDDLSIAVPDAEVIPLLTQRLEAWHIPARNAAGSPAQRTAACRFLAAAADYLRMGGRWESFAVLLRHPDLAEYLKRAEGNGHRPDPDRMLTEADRYFASRLPVWAPPPSNGSPAPLRVVRGAVDALLEPLRDSRALSAWPEAILSVLATLYGDRALRREVPEERRLVDTLSALREAGLSLSRIPPRADVECAGHEAIDLLIEAVRGATIPDDPDRSAVELLGWLEMHLDDAPVAVVTGFNEPHLPESVVSDAFLPDALRVHLGLLDDRTRYARDAYHLTATCASREAVRWISGRMSASGDPLRPSRLMLALRGERLARRVRRFSSGDGALPALPQRRFAALRSGFQLPPEPEFRFEPPTRVRVTAFRDLIADPYLFALTTARGLESLDDTAREMDGLLFGGLAHDVLRDFGHLREAGEDGAAISRERLDALLDATVIARFGRAGMLPAVRLQVEQLRLRLHRFADWQAERARDGWRIAFVEGCAAGGEAREDRSCQVAFEVDGLPITLSGRVDRIDHHPETGRWAVFDYKTGDTGDAPEKVHRKGPKSAKRWVDLQLPLYRHLVTGAGENGAPPLIEAVAPDELMLGYILLPRNLDHVGAVAAAWSPGELAEADETARGVIRALREGRAVFERDRISRFQDPGVNALLGRRQLVAALQEDEADA